MKVHFCFTSDQVAKFVQMRQELRIGHQHKICSLYYRSMMKARKRRVHESRQLEWKRKEHDAMEKKASKKKASSKAKKAVSG